MSIAKIVWLVSALAAIVLAFVNTGYDSTILAVLGLLSGWFLDANHRRGVIIAAIFLMMAGGAGALGGIVAIGAVLTKILSSLGAVFSAAAVMAIVRTLVERIFQSNAASATS
jgi:MFS family permease